MNAEQKPISRKLSSGTLLLVLSIFLGSCTTKPTGKFTDKGYKHLRYKYRIDFVEPKKSGNLIDGWEIDNFYIKNKKIRPKVGPDYLATLYFDVDGDGNSDEIGERLIYDLRLTNIRNAGVIWLRTIPVNKSLYNKDLRIMAQWYADALASNYYELVELQGKLHRTNAKRSYATKILEKNPGSVGKQEAYVMTLDVANINQLKLDPDARQERVRMVFIRTPFKLKMNHFKSRKIYKLPVIMVVGYANSTTDFEGNLKDFDDFLSRIKIKGKSGFSVENIAEETQVQEDSDENDESTQEESPAEEETAEPIAEGE